MEIGDSQSSNELLRKYCNELKEKVLLNRNILLVKGPQLNLNSFELEVAKNRCYYAYPPTGLQYLASAINHRNLDVKILDINYEFLKRVNNDSYFKSECWTDLLEEPLKKKPSIIGVSNLFSVDIPSFMEILNYLKRMENKPIVLVGGQNATYNGRKLLEDDLCNFVFERESETKLNYLLDVLYDSPQLNSCKGISFKYNGCIEKTEGANEVVELKGNLIDSHKLVPIEDYCKVGTLSPYSRMVGKDTPFATVLFNRGCEGGMQILRSSGLYGKRC